VKVRDLLTKLLLIVLPSAFLTACTSNAVNVPGISGAAQLTIYRDDWGVPHIYADQEAYGYFGLGYAQAEDQLINLLGGVYWVEGRQAELEGQALLASDIEQRRWRHAVEGRTGVQKLKPELLKNYQHFVAGVKWYMDAHPEKVPAWAPKLSVESLVAVNRGILWSAYASVLGPAECADPKVELISSIRSTNREKFTGASNGWVLGPVRTATGATLLLADPHTGLQNPAYYEYHLDAGDLKSSGFALGPMLWQAHNRHVSWAMTTGNPDMWDCYSVDVDPNDPNRYLYDGKWQRMLEVEEVFNVRGAEAEKRVFQYTMHNGVLSPVVARSGDKAYVVSVSQMHDTGLLDNEIHAMNHAGSVHELRTALSTLGMFPQNIIAGDDSGNIYYLRAGKTPIRPSGYNWKRAVPGNHSTTAWRGYYALEDMIEIMNPQQNYLQNNNVAPDVMFESDNVRASSYAKELYNDQPGRITTRGLRSIEVLSQATQFTLEDSMQHAFDEKWITVDYWLQALRYGVRTYPGVLSDKSVGVQNFIEELLGFDGYARAESSTALKFYYWREALQPLFLEQRFEHLSLFPWPEAQLTAPFVAELILGAERAMNNISRDFSGSEKNLGDVFRIGRGSDSWPVGGESITAEEVPNCLAALSPLCERTMRAYASTPLNETGQRRAIRGSQAMRLVLFTDPIQSFSLHAHGQSDNPDSLHYGDQSRLASERRFKPTYFDRDALEGHIESTLVINIDIHTAQ